MGDKEPKAKQRKAEDARKRAAKASAPKPVKAAPPKKKRQAHADGDYEALLREAKANKWEVTRDNGYFKCNCSCDDKHYVSVVLTPSSRRTLINTRKKFERSKCWKEAS